MCSNILYVKHKGNAMAQTKIQLQLPYASDWIHGYINVNSDGRRTVTLYNCSTDRSSTQYARYLMAVHLNRYLTAEEHVDHIDNDKTNDNLDNLQILSLKENNQKTFKQPDVNLVCPACKKPFTRTLTQLRGKKHLIESNSICCSRSCGGKFSHITKHNNGVNPNG